MAASCCRSRRNKVIQSVMISDRPNDFSFSTTRLWSTWSNAFAKSSKSTRVELPLSRAACQRCITSTNARVVERPFKPPNCLASSLSATASRIQPPTIPSRVQMLANCGCQRYGPEITGHRWVYYIHTRMGTRPIYWNLWHCITNGGLRRPVYTSPGWLARCASFAEWLVSRCGHRYTLSNCRGSPAIFDINSSSGSAGSRPVYKHVYITETLLWIF